jgi:hypothetical protein
MRGDLPGFRGSGIMRSHLRDRGFMRGDLPGFRGSSPIGVSLPRTTAGFSGAPVLSMPTPDGHGGGHPQGEVPRGGKAAWSLPRGVQSSGFLGSAQVNRSATARMASRIISTGRVSWVAPSRETDRQHAAFPVRSEQEAHSV